MPEVDPTQANEQLPEPERRQRRQMLRKAATLFGPLDDSSISVLERQADWISPARGEVVIRQGEPGESLFVLLAGRLEVIREETDGSSVVVGEVAPGESVGEMSFFTGQPRSATVRAIRDSLLVRFTNEAFERLIAAHPGVLRQVTRIQADRLQQANLRRRSSARVTNIAVLPLSPDVPLDAVCRRLAAALAPFGSTLHLCAAGVNAHLGAGDVANAADESPDEMRLVAWLSEREAEHRFVICEADPAQPGWTARALRQADRVLLVAHAGGATGAPAEIRRLLDAPLMPTPARRVLVLLHPDGSRLPRGTRAWLAAYPVKDHHHVRWDRDDDVARLARFLAGRAIGLALGGGGARGFAHIGIARALAEAGVPIDMIGGTSMGAAMAAQIAMGWTPEHMIEVNRRVWIEIRPHREFTFPLLSLVRSDGAERCGRMMYGDTQIEDLWRPYFCVSSDLTAATLRVHREGSLLRAVTASSSLPGVVVPVLEGDHLLVDGALFDNLPGDVMRDLGCGQVLVSRVSVEQDESFRYRRIPTLGEVLRARLRRRSDLRYPGLFEVVMRAALLASIHRENAVTRGADFVLRPPVAPFKLMEFDALEAIVEAGYAYSRGCLDEWRQQGRLQELLGVTVGTA